MKSNTYVLKHIVLLMAFFTGSHAVSQNIGFYAFLPDNDGNIDKDGFNIGYHSVYSQWDLNGDGDISEPEFYTIFFQRLDNNKNRSLSLKEWNAGEKYLFGQFINNENADTENPERLRITGFSKFDRNNNKKITSGEFDAGIRNTDFFRSYDSDQNGKLSRGELTDGVFKNMDLNGNGIIEQSEYNSLRKLYMK